MEMVQMNNKDKVCVNLSTLFGVGNAALLPGTAASAVGLVIFILISNQIVFFYFTLFILGVSYFTVGRAEKVFARKDCKKIVIDDFLGMLITYLFIPRSPLFIIVGFFLFRAYDVFKIPPADKLETYPGFKGVVGDDIVAGIYANLTLQIIRLIFY